MAVSATFRLPYGPNSWDISAGYTRVTPLGGNGYDNPHQELNFRLSLTGDATGGNSTLQLDFDNRYATVVDILICGVSADPGAAVDHYASITKHIAGASGSFVINTDDIPYNNALTGSYKQWLPPLEVYTPDAISQDFINSVMPNVNGQIHQVIGKLLYWNRQALEKVPYPTFAQALTPRA